MAPLLSLQIERLNFPDDITALYSYLTINPGRDLNIGEKDNIGVFFDISHTTCWVMFLVHDESFIQFVQGELDAIFGAFDHKELLLTKKLSVENLGVPR